MKKYDIDMDKIQRINFTLNPKNSFDYEVLIAIEKLKEEGYNISARIKKLLINDANNVVTMSQSNVTASKAETVSKIEPIKNEVVVDESNEGEDDFSGGFDIDIDLSDMPM